MNRFEVISFLKQFFTKLKNDAPDGAALKPFMDLVLSLKQNLSLSIPLLRDLASLGTDRETGFLKGRIDRRYKRLCRLQEELGRLDFKKAAPGVSPEDYIFSRIDFSRYRQIDEKEFNIFFLEGISDFEDDFYKRNFNPGIDRESIRAMIKAGYKKNEGVYRIQKETPLILSIMRTLETSLESSPLFTPEEIEGELKNLLDFVGNGSGEGREKLLPGMEKLFSLLVLGLDDIYIPHQDGMTTRLFISSEGNLSGTFRPGGKPWTLVLIPAEKARRQETAKL